MMPHRVCYKNASNARRWIAIGRFRCVSVGFNLSRYNSFDQRLRLNSLENDLSTNQDASRSALSDHQWSRFFALLDTPHAVTLPPAFTVDHDTIGRSRLRHITCALMNIQKIDF